MSDFFAVQLDKSKAAEGVLVRYRGDITLRIASVERAEYQEALVKAWKAHPSHEAGLSDEEDRELMAGVFSKTILLDWKNLAIGGEEIPYSEAKAKELLLHPEADLFDFVKRVSVNSANFERGKLAEAAGN